MKREIRIARRACLLLIFGEKDMRNWWIEKDFINFIPGKVITKDMELNDTVELIFQDVINA